jgi:Flp pilus assembly protein TadD/peroxiredoxin
MRPGADAFITEKYATELEVPLKSWRESLCAPTRDLRTVQALLPVALDASPLGKVTVKPLRLQPPVQSEKAIFPAPQRLSGTAFAESLNEYLAPFRRIEVAELQIDGIERVASAPLQLRTLIHYDLLGTLDDNRREERTGEWELTWQKDSAEKWSVLSWLATSELRSRLLGPGFVDITAACFASNPSYHEQMQHGSDHWRTVLDGASGIDIYGNNGICAGDFDGDGFDDLYVCQPAGLPNRLYRNRGDGTFADVTEKAGVAVLDGTSSAIFADLNNNGHQDLIVVRTSGPLLFINRGDGTFELKPDAFHFARPPQGTFTGLAVADYDRDGLLDVYFCLYSYYQGLSEYEFPKPYYDAQNGPPNFLLKNRGDYTFEDVTVSSGMDQNNNRFSFACGWNDYNNDGWPDLYVVNDFGRKNLYRNKGDGHFVDVSAEAGVEDPGAGMSVCWFDYDNDGFDDLYVANMWSAAGKRVSSQESFLPTAAESVRRTYRKHANGNSLFHNDAGNGGFRDATDESGTRLGRWSWCSDAWDFDHDGFSDLYVTNGFISGPEKDNLSSFFWRQIVARSLSNGGSSKDYGDAWSAINEFIRSDHSWSGYQRNNFYVNNRNGSFTEAAGILGLDFLDDSRSFALADLDHDGRLEVVVKNRNTPQIRVLHNQLNPLGSTISFSLKGTKSNRDAIGAVIELETEQGRQRNSIRAGSGYLAQHSKALCFGLGAAQTSVRATVLWPSGAKQVFDNLPPAHRIKIKEGSSTFEASPFTPLRAHAPSSNTPATDRLFEASQTWLVEPILAPDFKLKDQQGKMHSLTDTKGQPLVLVFWRSGCAESQEQLQAMQKLWPVWQRNNLNLLAACVDNPTGSSAVEKSAAGRGFSFPTLVPDENTSAIYNIFHRYLFERRRDMVLPTSLLLDREGAVLKVYSGAIDPARMLNDSLSAPVTMDDRLRRALPFEGRYFGKGLHHNYFTYGVAFLQYGYLDQALTSFQQSIARNPSYAAAYYNVGLIYLNKGMFDDARTTLEKAVELGPTNADAWNNLGVVYGQQGDYNRAQRDFQQAINLQPTHVLALQNMVKLYQFQGHLDEAENLLEKAIAIDPSNGELHQGLAMLLVERKDLPRARQEFDQAVQLQPRSVEALNGLGVVLMQMGDASEAMRRFEQCRRLAPSYDRPYLNMAVLYISAGKPEKAHEILSEYLVSQPDNPDIRQALQEVDSGK